MAGLLMGRLLSGGLAAGCKAQVCVAVHVCKWNATVSVETETCACLKLLILIAILFLSNLFLAIYS